VFLRHKYIDCCTVDLDNIVSCLFLHFNVNLSAVILGYFCEFFHRFLGLCFCANDFCISTFIDCNSNSTTQDSNVSLNEAREFINADFTTTSLVDCIRYLWFYEPIRVRCCHVNHLLGITRDFDWSNDIAICCDCTEGKFKCDFFYFKAKSVCLINHLMIYFSVFMTIFIYFAIPWLGFQCPSGCFCIYFFCKWRFF
jgi:hypothetical protein